MFYRGARTNFVSVLYAPIRVCSIAVRFVRVTVRNLQNVLAVQQCPDIRAADMDIWVILAEGIGRVVEVTCKVLNVRQRTLFEHSKFEIEIIAFVDCDRVNLFTSLQFYKLVGQIGTIQYTRDDIIRIVTVKYNKNGVGSEASLQYKINSKKAKNLF